MSEEFYLQDSRSYVGNDMLFWRVGGAGYTTNINEAAIYTKESAQAQHNMRDTDIPWPKSYIDGKTRPAVDMQYVRRDEALEGSGITINRPKKAENRRALYNCTGCGRFIKERGMYEGNCDHCGSDNRP